MLPAAEAPKQGLPCPECDTVIPMTIDRLLAGAPTFCYQCGTKFELVRDASAKALDALDKVNRAVKETKKKIEDIQANPEASLEELGGDSNALAE